MDSNQKGQIVVLTNVSATVLNFTDNLGRNVDIQKSLVASVYAEGEGVFIQTYAGTIYPIYYYTNASGITGTSATDLKTKISSVIGQADTRSYTIAANNTPSASHTGNTSETKLNASFLVASNTFNSLSRARFRALFTKSGTAGDCTIRCYINTTDSLSGATLISTSTFASASNIFSQFVRDIIFKSATTFQIYSASSSSAVTDRVATFAPSTVTYNTANSYYLIFSVQLANAADTVSINWYELLKM